MEPLCKTPNEEPAQGRQDGQPGIDQQGDGEPGDQQHNRSRHRPPPSDQALPQLRQAGFDQVFHAASLGGGPFQPGSPDRAFQDASVEAVNDRPRTPVDAAVDQPDQDGEQQAQPHGHRDQPRQLAERGVVTEEAGNRQRQGLPERDRRGPQALPFQRGRDQPYQQDHRRDGQGSQNGEQGTEPPEAPRDFPA